MLLPFKMQHTVHHVLQHLGACQGAFFVDVAHHKNGDAQALGQVHQGHGALLNLGHTAWRGVGLPVVHRLNGVHDQNIRLLLLHRRHHIVQVGLRVEIQPLPGDTQPLGPQLNLPLRLLAGHIEHRGKLAQAVADLQHQSGLADARGTAHQHQRALHGSPAQHAVQFAHSRGEAQFVGGLHVVHGTGLSQGRGGQAPPCFFLALRRRGGLLHNGVPGPTGQTSALPFGSLVSALGAVVHSFIFCHSDSS